MEIIEGQVIFGSREYVYSLFKPTPAQSLEVTFVQPDPKMGLWFEEVCGLLSLNKTVLVTLGKNKRTKKYCAFLRAKTDDRAKSWQCVKAYNALMTYPAAHHLGLWLQSLAQAGGWHEKGFVADALTISLMVTAIASDDPFGEIMKNRAV